MGSKAKAGQQVDVVAAIFKGHTAKGPVADAMLAAACRKLDRLGTVRT